MHSAPVFLRRISASKRATKYLEVFHATLSFCALDFDGAPSLPRSGIFVRRCLYQCRVCAACSARLRATRMPSARIDVDSRLLGLWGRWLLLGAWGMGTGSL